MKNVYNHASRPINRIDCALYQCVRVIPVPAWMLKLGITSEKILSYLSQTMQFGVLLGHSYSHEKKTENMSKILFSTDLFVYYTPTLPNLKSTQFCSSQLLSLLLSWGRNYFYSSTRTYFAYNIWYIHIYLLVYPFATVLVKHDTPPKSTRSLVTLCSALQHLLYLITEIA